MFLETWILVFPGSDRGFPSNQLEPKITVQVYTWKLYIGRNLLPTHAFLGMIDFETVTPTYRFEQLADTM